jgi:1-acyl-sn-glycerol-3-phosphate acyltransferase
VLARVLWRVETVWHEQYRLSGTNSNDGNRDRLLRDRIETGALLIANHRCSVDPFFIQLISGCRVHWMVAGEYFKHALFGPLLRSYQAIPTNRAGVDTASTKRAIALASKGHFVGMFPEGRINRTNEPLLTIRPGAAVVAQRASVPLVPIWIEGAPAGWEVYSALFMPAKVTIFVGYPCYSATTNDGDSASDSNFESSDSGTSQRAQARDAATAWIAFAMQNSLLMGGHKDAEVEFAGRKWVDS